MSSENKIFLPKDIFSDFTNKRKTIEQEIDAIIKEVNNLPHSFFSECQRWNCKQLTKNGICPVCDYNLFKDDWDYRHIYRGHDDMSGLRGLIFKIYGKKCMKCNCMENVQIDHIKSKSEYPSESLDIDNLQVLCRSCNSSKYQLEMNYYSGIGPGFDLEEWNFKKDYRCEDCKLDWRQSKNGKCSCECVHPERRDLIL